MLLMLVVRIIDVVVRAVRFMAGGTAAGYLLMATVVVLFVGTSIAAVAGGAWVLGTLENRYHWMESVFP